jgi:hypothetical protein
VSVHTEGRIISLEHPDGSTLLVVDGSEGFSFEVTEESHWAWVRLSAEQGAALAEWLGSRTGRKA